MENSKEKKIKIPEVATVKHDGHRQRLHSDIFQLGFDSSPPVKTLEYILTLAIPRVDTNPIAHRLLETFGSISAVLDASPKQLQQVRGIGPRAAQILSLFPQFFSFYYKDKVKNTKFLLNKGQTIKYCSAMLLNKQQEELYAICLDKAHKVQSTILIAQGDTTKISFKKQDLLSKILVVPNLHKILLTHSHPNSTPYPSAEDKEATEEIKRLLSYCGVEFYDHIIVGLTHSYSYQEGRMYENF